MDAKLLRFSVRGDGGHIEIVHASLNPRMVTLTCTCKGERPGFMCKHRRRLLEGDETVLLSGNVEDMRVLIAAADATDCARWFAIGASFEVDMDRIRDNVRKAGARCRRRTKDQKPAIPQPLEKDTAPPPQHRSLEYWRERVR
ncbi:MAG: hypothetical protein AAGB11_02985 [Pseudomonadota bacterium]